MSITTFVAGLSNPITDSQAEEYLTISNTFDAKYLSMLVKERVSEAKLRKLINAQLGKITFEKKNITNEVSNELFQEHYSFGTYPDVRGWIGYFARTMDMVLTRSALYEFISNS